MSITQVKTEAEVFDDTIAERIIVVYDNKNYDSIKILIQDQIDAVIKKHGIKLSGLAWRVYTDRMNQIAIRILNPRDIIRDIREEYRKEGVDIQFVQHTQVPGTFDLNRIDSTLSFSIRPLPKMSRIYHDAKRKVRELLSI